MGIDPSYKVIGTVMRNQRRKLYPDLFEAFRKFLDMSEDKNYYLYCHTSYPDLGWNIDELLQEHNLASHVLFTYICPETKKPFVSKFKGAVAQSPFTNKWGSTLSNVKNGLSYEDLSKVVNCFDLYTQYANCEGFGLPQVEAAACGVPVCGTDYSAMESVLRKLEGYPITPAALYKELETGCLRAVPDNDVASKFFYDFFQKTDEERAEMGKKTREAFDKYYQWHLSGSVWENYFDSTNPVSFDRGWGSAPKILPPAEKQDLGQLRHSQVTRWLIENVLRQPEKVNSFFADRMTKDLLYKSATSSTGGMYFNESSAAFDGQQHRSHFDFNVAYDQMKMQRERINHWEQARVNRMKALNV